jgi:dihydroorotate dehydrogenase electron transfer subunit
MIMDLVALGRLWALHKSEKSRNVKILDIKKESSDITSIWFEDEEVKHAEAGQFVMIWVPGVDEVPMSISTIDKNGRSSVSVRVVGEATEAIIMLKPGDSMGLRGPFGNGFKVEGSNQLFVAGGSGATALFPLVEKMVLEGHKPTFVLGARTADMLIFVDRLQEILGDYLVISTDDGSQGYSGYASGYAALLIDEHNYDQIYTCGPEIMMAKIFQIAEKKGISVEASLERYVKCSVGLCGNCTIGSYRVCNDGPVFNSEMLNEVKEEFGISRMDPAGQSIRVDH